MTTTETLRNNSSGFLASFWLLVPKWLRRLPRHCEDCGGTSFLLDTATGASAWTGADRARRVKLPMTQSLIEGLRDGAMHR